MCYALIFLLSLQASLLAPPPAATETFAAMHMSFSPAAPALGAQSTGSSTILSVAFTDAATGSALAQSALVPIHEALLHMVLLGSDYSSFLHLHPAAAPP